MTAEAERGVPFMRGLIMSSGFKCKIVDVIARIFVYFFGSAYISVSKGTKAWYDPATSSWTRWDYFINPTSGFRAQKTEVALRGTSFGYILCSFAVAAFASLTRQARDWFIHHVNCVKCEQVSARKRGKKIGWLRAVGFHFVNHLAWMVGYRKLLVNAA